MAGSSSQAATQDKGKGPIIAPSSPPALRILNQVNDEVIDDPHLQTNDTRILIFFTIDADTHCFLGPIESLERANKKLSFFPSAGGEDLLINQAFNISHFINQKSFRNNPKINPRGYDFTAWYRRLEPTKNADWKALGIHELLRLSHFSLTTYPWMIGAVTCFWNRTSNNFHLPCGMIGISLLDVVIYYSDFIAHNMGAEGTKITENEHVAFLFYWLNAILFCYRSIQISKLYLSLATLLHEGKSLNLAKFLLGHIFEELGQFVCDLRDNRIISARGPLWLLQLWFNAIFENFMTKPESGSTDKQYIEGFRLSDFKPNFLDTQSDEDRFWAVFSIFHSCKDFENDKLNFTPFLHRNRGPAWLDRLLFPDTNEENELANQNWANMLVVQVILIGLPLHKKERFKVTLYAPHLTARQLGFSQAIPTPQPRNDAPFCHIALTTQEDFNSCLLKNQQRWDRFNFVVYDCSFYITKCYFESCATYYSRYTRTLEEIQQNAIRTIPVAESSPKRTHKRKAETTRPPPSKSKRTPTRTSRKHSTVAHSITYPVMPDQPILQQQHDQGHSSSHDSIQFTGPTQTIPAAFPPLLHTTQTPPRPKPGTSSILTTPTNATLDDLISVLNKVIQENKVPVPVPAISRPATSRPSIKLDPDIWEQLRSLLKLLDHPPTTWVNDPILNKLLAAKAQSNIENYLATVQPIQVSREEFDLRISHAISIQDFHDQEEARLAELTQIQEQLATIRQNRATIAKHLAAAQQEQHLLIQELVSIDTKRGEYEK
ncbi:hypothetical protein Ahy_A09g045720 [Arachis hypogaea]|uniref:Aminotransferase-like plant mobile domain-containing protein n=1 Tax=Arachis hypogaea TaxID=3818 RepID=A0A445BN03_ARAHY|nr:hypothetical protein Ahy_A09g045720 [Arachis hypogaea]